MINICMDKAYRIRVHGKVQGVFFRASTKAKADELSVKGIVRNEPDGSVYIEAQADESIMEQFVSWCRQGPQHARVDKLEVSEIALKDLTNFFIER